MLSFTPLGRVAVSSHPSDAQSHPLGTGPGLTKIEKIKRLCGGDLVVSARASAPIDAEMG